MYESSSATPVTANNWTYQGEAGVFNGTGGGFGHTGTFPDGSQAAFIQASPADPTSTVTSSSFTLGSTSDVSLSYFAACRNLVNASGGNDNLTAEIVSGNTVIDSFGTVLTSSNEAFTSETPTDVVLEAGTYELEFVATARAGRIVDGRR
jgi:hypothetical protein